MNSPYKKLIGIFVLIIGVIGGIKTCQVVNMPAWAPNPDAITSYVASEQPVTSTYSATGSVEAVQGIMLTSEQAGIISELLVESGALVNQGDVLFKINSEVEDAQLKSALAREDLAKRSFNRAQQLLNSNGISRAEYDDAAAELQRATADAAVIQAVINQKNIKAPFSGRVGIRAVNLGQYIKEGQDLIQIFSINPVYVNFSVPQRILPYVKPGQKLSIKSDAFPQEIMQGEVSAVNPAMDSASRSLLLQAKIDNTQEKLRSGMFVNIELQLGEPSNVIMIPNTAVSYAPYGNSVFVVEMLKDPAGKEYKGVKQRFVKLGDSKGDFVAVIDGLKAGQEVATSAIFKLRNGSAVVVDNSSDLPKSTEPVVSES